MGHARPSGHLTITFFKPLCSLLTSSGRHAVTAPPFCRDPAWGRFFFYFIPVLPPKTVFSLPSWERNHVSPPSFSCPPRPLGKNFWLGPPLHDFSQSNPGGAPVFGPHGFWIPLLSPPLSMFSFRPFLFIPLFYMTLRCGSISISIVIFTGPLTRFPSFPPVHYVVVRGGFFFFGGVFCSLFHVGRFAVQAPNFIVHMVMVLGPVSVLVFHQTSPDSFLSLDFEGLTLRQGMTQSHPLSRPFLFVSLSLFFQGCPLFPLWSFLVGRPQ